MELSIDNDPAQTVTIDTYNDTRLVQQTVYSNKNLSPGTHTIKLKKVSGTYMLVDVLKVYTGVVPITSYTDGQYLNVNTPEITWTYSDPDKNTVQSAYRVQGFSIDNWATIAFDSVEVLGAGTSYKASALPDSPNWSIRVQARNINTGREGLIAKSLSKLLRLP